MRVRMFVIVAAIASAAQGGPGAAQGARGVRLSEMTWPQAAGALRPDAVVVIPLGAGSLEHGAHMKLGVDYVLAEYLTRRVIESKDVIVAPPLDYHFVPAFIDHAGSASLTSDAARALTNDLVSALARYGARRFYVLNTAASAARPLAEAARMLAQQGVLLAYTDAASELERASVRIRQEQTSTHGGEIETSMMLYIDSASVDMRRAVREQAGTTFRDPTFATLEKGKIVVDALVSAVLNDIDTLRRTPLPSPSSGPAPAPAVQSPQRMTAGPRSCSPGDERVIRGFADAFTYFWANADAERLASMWERDGDMVHPDGSIERGREVIRANRTALFARPEYRASKHPLTMGMIRCVDTDVAVADGKWELRGVVDDKGKALPTFEGQFTIVTKRTDEGWLIEAYRYTQKPAAAPMPTLLKRPGIPGGH
jgi:creatinine amidohydrolase